MLSGRSIEGAMYDLEDGSKDLEDPELGSLDDMCGGNKDRKFEGSSLVEPL